MMLPDPDSNIGTFRSLRVLLIIGDWACGLQDAQVLADVARCLAPCLAAPHQMELDEIAQLSSTDVSQASTRWAILSKYLRDQLTVVMPEAGAYRA